MTPAIQYHWQFYSFTAVIVCYDDQGHRSAQQALTRGKQMARKISSDELQIIMEIQVLRADNS